MRKDRIQTILCIVLSIALIATLALGINKSKKEKEKILQSKKQYESSINTASKPEEETKEGNIEEEKQESEEKLTLEGKTLLSLGDGVSKVSTYQEKVKNLLNLKSVINNSNNGLVMSSMISYINKEALKDTDIIMIMVGTNDYTKGRALGTIDDGGEVESFYGDVQAVINAVKNAKPEVKPVFLTPLKHGNIEGQPSYPDKNNIELGLDDYAKAIKDVCDKNSIPVVDLFNKSGIEAENIAQYTVDNMNLNEAGNEKVAKTISEALQKIYK
ncbi:hypothetical protein GCM10008908_07620 [Clostridium subterminale]|uniref:SGNH hydrolase-type esterase domain-containing protein n=1 Tax=Clostridium subterminale TaxID=1550 RepID=A0ABP3VTW8_CLOSU